MTKLNGIGARVAVIAIALGVIALGATGAEDIGAQIAAANRVFMATFEKGDAAGVAALYTADAKVFAAGMDVVSGTAAIEAYWKGGMQSGIKRVTLTTIEAEQHGDTAIEVGQADLLDADGKRIDQIKYIVIWKRADGQWKLHLDIFNTNLPADAAE